MRLFTICLAVLLLVGCDSNGGSVPEQEPEATRELSTTSTAVLENDFIRVIASGLGLIGGLQLIKGSWNFNAKLVLSQGTIWLAVNQNGPKAVLPMSGRFPVAFQEYANDSTGFFVVTPDSLDQSISNWPHEFGAPVHPDGSPRLYGNQMAWSAFRSAESGQYSIDGLQLGMSVYIHNDALVNYVFHRYDIYNAGNSALQDLHIGYGADIDIRFNDRINPECQSLDHWDNQVGYNEDLNFSYFYLSRVEQDGDLPDHCYGNVYGYSILPLSDPMAIGSDILASRIWRRDANTTQYPDFSEDRMTSPEMVQFALHGRSVLGDPMFNPVTGKQTNFAFTGDPVTGTGWLDERHDGRSMISFQPITLSPGERASFTVVYFWAEANSLAEGIAEAKSRLGYILRFPEYWDY